MTKGKTAINTLKHKTVNKELKAKKNDRKDKKTPPASLMCQLLS